MSMQGTKLACVVSFTDPGGDGGIIIEWFRIRRIDDVVLCEMGAAGGEA